MPRGQSIDVVCGVYKIICTSTGKFYVGSSQNIWKRWRQHRTSLSQNAHYNNRLQKAWNTHGCDCFVLEIIEIVADRAALFSREQHYLESLSCHFNLTRTAGGAVLRGKKHTTLSRKKMTDGQIRYWERRRASGRDRHSEETKAKIAASHIGIKASAAARKKMSDSAKKRPPRKLSKKEILAFVARTRTKSPQTCRNISKALTGRKLSEKHRQHIRDGLKRYRENIAGPTDGSLAVFRQPSLF